APPPLAGRARWYVPSYAWSDWPTGSIVVLPLNTQGVSLIAHAPLSDLDRLHNRIGGRVDHRDGARAMIGDLDSLPSGVMAMCSPVHPGPRLRGVCPVWAAIRICLVTVTKSRSWPSQRVIGFAGHRAARSAPNDYECLLIEWVFLSAAAHNSVL